jgi:hypothetical protein
MVADRESLCENRIYELSPCGTEFGNSVFTHALKARS